MPNPDTADAHRFGVEWSDDAHGKRRRVIIEFNAELGTVEIDALKELTTSWEGLLERGDRGVEPKHGGDAPGCSVVSVPVKGNVPVKMTVPIHQRVHLKDSLDAAVTGLHAPLHLVVPVTAKMPIHRPIERATAERRVLGHREASGAPRGACRREPALDHRGAGRLAGATRDHRGPRGRCPVTQSTAAPQRGM